VGEGVAVVVEAEVVVVAEIVVVVLIVEREPGTETPGIVTVTVIAMGN
jgi:hypothetical protein